VIRVLDDGLGIKLPSYEWVPEEGGSVHVDGLASAETEWEACEPPYQTWDVMMFEIGSHLHVGIMVDDHRFLCAMQGVGSCTYSIRRMLFARTLIRAYRHRSQ
jgi:hypothetical protein